MSKYEIKISLENKGRIGTIHVGGFEKCLNDTVETLGWKLEIIECKKIGD